MVPRRCFLPTRASLRSIGMLGKLAPCGGGVPAMMMTSRKDCSTATVVSKEHELLQATFAADAGVDQYG